MKKRFRYMEFVGNECIGPVGTAAAQGLSTEVKVRNTLVLS